MTGERCNLVYSPLGPAATGDSCEGTLEPIDGTILFACRDCGAVRVRRVKVEVVNDPVRIEWHVHVEGQSVAKWKHRHIAEEAATRLRGLLNDGAELYVALPAVLETMKDYRP